MIARPVVLAFGWLAVGTGLWVAIQPSGLVGVRSIMEWGAGLQPIVFQLVGLITIGFGGFIVRSLWPQKGSEA